MLVALCFNCYFFMEILFQYIVAISVGMTNCEYDIFLFYSLTWSRKIVLYFHLIHLSYRTIRLLLHLFCVWYTNSQSIEIYLARVLRFVSAAIFLFLHSLHTVIYVTYIFWFMFSIVLVSIYIDFIYSIFNSRFRYMIRYQ